MRSTNLLDIAVGALGAETAILFNTKIDVSRLQGCNPRKIEWSFEWNGKTANQGPLIFGVIELVVAEMKEWWQADPQHDGDFGSVERSQRHVKILGYIGKLNTAGGDGTAGTGNTTPAGVHHATWPGWDIVEGEFLDFFVMNIGLSSVSSGIVGDGFINLRGDWNAK